MLVTPLQMALVAAAIANNGVEMTPTLIQRIVAPGGSVDRQARARRSCAGRRAADDRGRAQRNMMVEVVQAGTGTAAQIPGVVVAGKTGTAETCSCNTSTTPGSSSSPRPSTRSSRARSSSRTSTTASAARSRLRSPSS